MKESSRQLPEKAQSAIRAAKTLLDNEYADFAAGRAYYAMFYIAEALLNEKELRFSKHGGVHGAFDEHNVKTGLFNAKFHHWLLNAFDQRIQGDYHVGVVFTVNEVREIIQQAAEFLQEAHLFLEGKW